MGNAVNRQDSTENLETEGHTRGRLLEPSGVRTAAIQATVFLAIILRTMAPGLVLLGGALVCLTTIPVLAGIISLGRPLMTAKELLIPAALGPVLCYAGFALEYRLDAWILYRLSRPPFDFSER